MWWRSEVPHEHASSPMQPWPFDGKVSNGWFDRGAWLCQAAEIFCDDHQIVQFRQQVERFAELRDGETPEMFEGSSNFSGEARKKLLDRLVFDEEKNAFRLYLAFKDLLQMTLKNRLGSGSLVAFGARGAADADFIWIPREPGTTLTCTSTKGTSSEEKGWPTLCPRHRPSAPRLRRHPSISHPKFMKQEAKSILKSGDGRRFLAWTRRTNEEEADNTPMRRMGQGQRVWGETRTGPLRKALPSSRRPAPAKKSST